MNPRRDSAHLFAQWPHIRSDQGPEFIAVAPQPHSGTGSVQPSSNQRGCSHFGRKE